MAHFCVSDIHGRFDLFIEGLNKINFSPSKDKLYILGDVCNGGPDSLKIYDYILNHPGNITLIKGNHDVFLVDILKAYQEVLTHPDLFEILKEYVVNYVSGFEKNRTKACRKTSKYSTTNRRKICVETFKKYVLLAKNYKIENFHLLVTFYESYFKTRKLMLESTFINQSKTIKTLTLNYEKWVMYHSRYSEKQASTNQLVDRLKRSYSSKNVNYIYGHTPIPKVHKMFTNETLNYNLIFKTIDFNGNKYYNIDVSHYGICFLNLETLEETYIGKHNDKPDFHSRCRLDEFEIENITEPYSRIKRFIIKLKDYVLALAILQTKEKILHIYEFCNLGEKGENYLKLILDKDIKMQDVLELFVEKYKTKT